MTTKTPKAPSAGALGIRHGNKNVIAAAKVAAAPAYDGERNRMRLDRLPASFRNGGAVKLTGIEKTIAKLRRK